MKIHTCAAAVAISASMSAVATADYDIYCQYLSLNSDYSYNDGWNFAGDFSNYGQLVDYDFNPYFEHETTSSVIGDTMTVSWTVSTFGDTFATVAQLGGNQPGYNGTNFVPNALGFDMGNQQLGTYGYGEVDGFDIGSDYVRAGDAKISMQMLSGETVSYDFTDSTGTPNFGEYFCTFSLLFDQVIGSGGQLAGDATSFTITQDLTLIPAPGALALLGLGGVAMRRRRS